MSLHRQITLKLSDTVLSSIVLACIVFGLLLPVMLSPPRFLSMEGSNKALFEEIARLEEEVLRLQALKTQQGLSLAQKQEIDRQMEIASTQLSQGLLLSDKNLTKQSLLTAPTPRPPIPQIIKYRLPQSDVDVVPRIFIPRMPNLTQLEVAERKELFIKIILPLILRANEEIQSHREKIDNAFERGDRATLEQFGRQYKVKSDKTDTELYDILGRRVAPIPVSIALAQAAIESGWGQSRFTEAGNALFGQWVWNDDIGIKAKQASDERASVQAFPDLMASVRAYMLNLNTFYAYQGFRQSRVNYLAGQTNLEALLAELSVYAEIRDEYVETLKTVIHQNDFNRFNQARLSVPIF